MPIYEFKCRDCKKSTEVFLNFSDFNAYTPDAQTAVVVGLCSNKKCKGFLYKQDQQINFAGGINMNASSVGVAKRKYSNAAGGPRPIIDNKVRNDLKIKGI